MVQLLRLALSNGPCGVRVSQASHLNTDKIREPSKAKSELIQCVSIPSRRNAAPQVSSSISTSEWSPDDYLATAASSLPAEKKTDLFEALEKPTTVINLNDTSAVSRGKSLFKWGDSELPRAKKMKLKVAPPKVIVSSFQVTLI